MDPNASGALFIGCDEGVRQAQDWCRAERPLVVRRTTGEVSEGYIAAGLKLPLSMGSKKFDLAVESAAILRVEPPMSLDEVLDSSPKHWRPVLEELTSGISACAVFGALMWQAVSGEAYVHEASDLDLLVAAHAQLDLSVALDRLIRIAEAAPMRIDGEILGDAGGAHWREVADRTSMLIVKSLNRVTVLSREEFLSMGAKS